MTSSTTPELVTSSLSIPGAMASPTIAALATALAKAQGTMNKAQRKTDNSVFQSKYADLASVIDAIGNSLSSNGLSYLQRAHCVPSHVAIETIILHESGEFLSAGILSVPVEGSMSIQDHGTAITYVRRYALQTALGIVSDDDDGNAATAASTKPSEGTVAVKTVVQKVATEKTKIDPPKTDAATETKPAAVTAEKTPETPVVAAIEAKTSTTEVSPTNSESSATSVPLENDAEANDLRAKKDFVNGYSVISRLQSLKDRASELFKVKENAADFAATIEARILVLEKAPAA